MTENNANLHTSAPSFGAEHFDKVAATYKPTSAMLKIACELISLAPSISSTSIVLDNASGPGIVTGEIMRQSASAGAPPPTIYAADISPAMVELVVQNNWSSVRGDVMDAQELSYPDNTFTHVFMNMGIFLLPEPEKGAKEMYRALKPGGVAVVTSIKQVGWVRIFQAAQKKVRPGAPLWKGPLGGEWSREDKLRGVMENGGFRTEDINLTTIESSQLSSMVGHLLDSMKDNATKMITGDWNDVEKQHFEVCLQEEFEKAASDPEELEVVMWVAVARK